MGDAEFGEQFLDHRFKLARIGFDQFGGGADVLFGGQAAEDRCFLRQIANAQPRAAIHRQPRDVVAFDLDRAGIGRDEAGDDVEAGRLAGAVGSQKAHDFAALHRQADAAHDGALVEALSDAGDDEALAAFDHAWTRGGGVIRNLGIRSLAGFLDAMAKTMPVRV